MVERVFCLIVLLLCGQLMLRKHMAWTRDFIKKEHIRWISRQIPKCCLVFIEGAMHLDFYKRMEWYYPFIRRFIR